MMAGYALCLTFLDCGIEFIVSTNYLGSVNEAFTHSFVHCHLNCRFLQCVSGRKDLCACAEELLHPHISPHEKASSQPDASIR